MAKTNSKTAMERIRYKDRNVSQTGAIGEEYLNEGEGLLRAASAHPAANKHGLPDAAQTPVLAAFDVRNSQSLAEFRNGGRRHRLYVLFPLHGRAGLHHLRHHAELAPRARLHARGNSAQGSSDGGGRDANEAPQGRTRDARQGRGRGKSASGVAESMRQRGHEQARAARAQVRGPCARHGSSDSSSSSSYSANPTSCKCKCKCDHQRQANKLHQKPAELTNQN